LLAAAKKRELEDCASKGYFSVGPNSSAFISGGVATFANIRVNKVGLAVERSLPVLNVAQSGIVKFRFYAGNFITEESDPIEILRTICEPVGYL
jgi:hypothetical protein